MMLTGSDGFYAHSLHHYAKALIASVPVLDSTMPKRPQDALIAGDLPSPINPPRAVYFAPDAAIQQIFAQSKNQSQIQRMKIIWSLVITGGRSMLDKLSLGLRTELMLLKPFGALTAHFDCLQFVSPAMPDYFFGNCLIFPKPHAAGDFPRWTSRFETLFAELAGIRHQTFLWPSLRFVPSDILPFTEAGFGLDATTAMTSARPKAHRPLGAGIALRQVTSDADWQAASDLQISVGLEDMEYTAYSDFERRRMAILKHWAVTIKGG